MRLKRQQEKARVYCNLYIAITGVGESARPGALGHQLLPLDRDARERVYLWLKYLGTQRRIELATKCLFIPLHHYVDTHFLRGRAAERSVREEEREERAVRSTIGLSSQFFKTSQFSLFYFQRLELLWIVSALIYSIHSVFNSFVFIRLFGNLANENDVSCN